MLFLYKHKISIKKIGLSDKINTSLIFANVLHTHTPRPRKQPQCLSPRWATDFFIIISFSCNI